MPRGFEVEATYRCNSCKTTLWRSGNKALESLANDHNDLDFKLGSLVESLPRSAQHLYELAQLEHKRLKKLWAEACLFPAQERSDLTHEDQDRSLVNCIFDLISVGFFQEKLSYCENKEFASILVDALTYEATGQVATVPTEKEVRILGTQNHRGIAKFSVASRV